MKQLMKNICLPITMALLCLQMNAQVNLTNTGTLYLTGGSDILFVNGGLSNTSTAAFTNNGNIYVAQALNNDQAAMAIGTGTLYLNGTASQSVTGSQPYKAYNLNTNNTGGIVLNNDLSITGTHTFTAGIISSSATPNYLIYEAGSSYSGDGDTKHVSGWVQKNGSSNFTFPLGNGTVERTIGVSSLSAASVFKAKYAGATTNTSNLFTPLVVVDNNEYWNLNLTSGGTATVNMNWDNSKIAMPNFVLSAIKVANYTGGNWTQEGGSASGNVTTTGTISSATLSSFGPFTLGSTAYLLPVTFVNFNVATGNGANTLNWTTENESNIAVYAAQRSDDGAVWYTLGTVKALNNSGTSEYSFSDTKSIGALAYYRIQSIGIDGQKGYTKVITVSNHLPGANYFSVNNPATGSINIVAGSRFNGAYAYRLTTLSGQLLQQGNININSGGAYQIPLSRKVPAGLYLFSIQNSQFQHIQKLVVQ